MKTTTQKVIWSIGGLCLIWLAYACRRNEDAVALKPYTFASLQDLQLPKAKVSAPPPVTVVPSSLSLSGQAAQVKTGIASIPGSGQIPAPVSLAIGDVANALTSSGVAASDLVAGFTPQVIATLTAQGVLPGTLQAQINTLTSNAALLSYLTSFTYAQVNNQPVGPTTTSIVGPGTVASLIDPITVNPINYTGSDACLKAANDLFDSKIVGLDADRLAQIATTNTTYQQAKSAAEADQPGCVSGVVAKYTALATTAQQNLTSTIASLDAAKATLGPTNYNLLLAMVYVLYSQQIQTYLNLQTADINTCAITQTTKVASVLFARDTDINSINDGFNTTIKLAQTIVLQLYDSCHNQGSGH